MKTQSSLEKVVIVAVVVTVAIILSILVYSGVIKLQKSQNINYVSSIILGNIYNNNNTIFVITKNNSTIGANAMIYFRATTITDLY